MRSRFVRAAALFAAVGAGALFARVQAQPAPASAPIVHVVLFDLAADATPAEVQALADDSRRLLPGIPGVEAVWTGPKALDDREAHVKDYDVALCVRLKSLADLPAYAAHPQHRALVDKWKTRATWRVIDFFDR
jgi:Stress responsive A/B Barrel Domain